MLRQMRGVFVGPIEASAIKGGGALGERGVKERYRVPKRDKRKKVRNRKEALSLSLASLSRSGSLARAPCARTLPEVNDSVIAMGGGGESGGNTKWCGPGVE